VDLPSDDSEAPLARSKFETAVEGLRRVYPEISEARATVKVSSPMGERKRFEVHALIRMPRRQFDFTAEGWSLAEAFDIVSGKLKRLRTKPDKKQSYRRHRARSEVAIRPI
jgi:ribosome-associated translation inhibitor RaiA